MQPDVAGLPDALPVVKRADGVAGRALPGQRPVLRPAPVEVAGEDPAAAQAADLAGGQALLLRVGGRPGPPDGGQVEAHRQLASASASASGASLAGSAEGQFGYASRNRSASITMSRTV